MTEAINALETRLTQANPKGTTARIVRGYGGRSQVLPTYDVEIDGQLTRRIHLDKILEYVSPYTLERYEMDAFRRENEEMDKRRLVKTLQHLARRQCRIYAGEGLQSDSSSSEAEDLAENVDVDEPRARVPVPKEDNQPSLATDEMSSNRSGRPRPSYSHLYKPKRKRGPNKKSLLGMQTDTTDIDDDKDIKMIKHEDSDAIKRSMSNVETSKVSDLPEASTRRLVRHTLGSITIERKSESENQSENDEFHDAKVSQSDKTSTHSQQTSTLKPTYSNTDIFSRYNADGPASSSSSSSVVSSSSEAEDNDITEPVDTVMLDKRASLITNSTSKPPTSTAKKLDGGTSSSPTSTNSTSSSAWEVETILTHSLSDPKTHPPDQKGKKPITLYKVKWTGWDEPTWEPETSFNDRDVVRDYWDRMKREADSHSIGDVKMET